MAAAHLAFDLGASSGRAIVGVLDDSAQTISLEELHRFEHLPCPTPAGPVWDLTGIWQNILTGLRNATDWCNGNQIELKSVGVDTWGVDWALIGASGELVGLPHCYRDPQNDAACERTLERLGGFDQLYERTGIQLMSLNTLFQVVARHEQDPRLFDSATRLLMLPDLLHYWLSGELATERTIASTSSMLDVATGEWDLSLLNELGLPSHIFGPIVEPGTAIGKLRQEICELTGASANVQVILPGAHDTASAVAAVPAVGSESWAYLSSGTWSLLGAELDHPIANDASRAIPLTNERGVSGTIRLLKNIGGLWLIQELRRDFQRQGKSLGFDELVELARNSKPLRTLVDPNYSAFASPGDMAAKICAFAADTEQPKPESEGQLVRCCLESLALCYRQTLSQLEGVLGSSIDVLHMVGGGIQNRLLNEFTSAAVQKKVIAGPIEATAIGNLLIQAMGAGVLSDLNEVRQVVANSFELETIEAKQDGSWDDAKAKYHQLITK